MNRFSRNSLLFLLLLLAAAGASFFLLVRETVVPRYAEAEALNLPPASGRDAGASGIFAEAGQTEPVEPDAPPEEAWPQGHREGEMIFRFESRSDLEKFRRDARRAGLGDVEVEPALRLVRLRNLDGEKARRARRLLPDGAAAGFNPFVLSPDPPPMAEVEERGGASLPFHDRALEWLGVPEDNGSWGEGVRVAVLDTGVDVHPSLSHLSINRLSMIDPASAERGNGTHGTAVASLLSGGGGGVRGIAPGVDLMSVQVLDADGVGDGFSLAGGVVAAVDAGARIINLSLGTGQDSMVLRSAVDYALSHDVILVASAGNEGAAETLYPARYPEVVGVAAVDAGGEHVGFSNRGAGLSIAAPGYGLNAAADADGVASFNGTSGATPLVTGAVAALLSQNPGMTGARAVELITGYSDDAGPPGADGYFGEGLLNMERVLRRGEPGIHDIAIADHYLDTAKDVPELVVTVQNRGTEPAGNLFLEVDLPSGRQSILLGHLEVGQVKGHTLPLREVLRPEFQELEVRSRVRIPGTIDDRPENDRHSSRVGRRAAD